MPIKISGLKCDNCDWRNDAIPFEDYPKCIGKPCPRCGNNLLTQEEYDNCVAMAKRVEKIERVLYYFRFLNPMFYLRLIFGDNRKEKTLTFEYPKRSTNEQD
jgi:hypothetical protein